MRSQRPPGSYPEAAGRRWDVEVLFRPTTLGEPAGGRARWHPSPGADSTWLRADGRQVLIAEGGGTRHDDDARVRLALPYAAALQGRLMLHAAAAAAPDGIHAFVGPSGAGKSTLARQLALRAVAVVGEDLLLCRERRGRIGVPVEPDGWRPLAAVYFLQRTAGLARLRLAPLSRKECFLRLLRHGFGELALGEVWARQFRISSEIAHRTRGLALEMPDDLGRLAESVEILIREQLSGPGPAPAGDRLE